MSSSNRIRWALVGVFVALAWVYAWRTPPLEAPDESTHLAMADYIATHGALPVQRRGEETLWAQEGSQPPLYYMLGALLIAPIARDDLPNVLAATNPHARIGLPASADEANANVYLHPPKANRWSGALLALQVLRAFSVALGALTVWQVYAVARLAAPRDPWVAPLAQALTAFTPTFVHISASVNNDNMVVALATVSLALILRSAREGLTARRVWALGAALALGTLAKLSGWALYPLAALALLWRWRQGDSPRALARAALVWALCWAALAGWWYARNLALYGEFFGLQTMLDIFGRRRMDSIWALLGEFEGFRVSYWAIFGWFNVRVHGAFYAYADLFALTAALGVGVWLWRRARARTWDALAPVALLIAFVGLVAAGVMRWTWQTSASQGRLLFPAISAVSTLAALGLRALAPPKREAVTALLLAPFALMTVAVPLRALPRAFAPPPLLGALPAEAVPVYARWEGIELLGYRTEARAVHPRGALAVTLYWRVTAPPAHDYSLYLHLFGRDMQQLGALDTYPARGNWPARAMPVGRVVADRYVIPLQADHPRAPTALKLQVGWWNYATGEYLQAVDADGQPLPSVLLAVGKLVDPLAAPPHADHAVQAAFGGFAQLRGWSLSAEALAPEDVFRVALVWQATGTPAQDWTVFVHLLDAQGQAVAFGDAPPLGGQYPTTLWDAGEWVEDVHTVRLPADLLTGEYTLCVGWYDAATFVRAPLRFARGELLRATADALCLARVRVE